MDEQELWKEYKQLDQKLTAFRRRWNAQAFKDLEYAKINHVPKGKQGDFPAWWYQDVERWKELKRLLNIR